MRTSQILLPCVMAGLSTSDAFVPTTQRSALTNQLHSSTVPDMDMFENDNDNKEKKLPKNSQSIPFLARPKFLTQELAGDVGFDPLNLAKNRELLMEYREAEIKHSRLAMLAALGMFSRRGVCLYMHIFIYILCILRTMIANF